MVKQEKSVIQDFLNNWICIDWIYTLKKQRYTYNTSEENELFINLAIRNYFLKVFSTQGSIFWLKDHNGNSLNVFFPSSDLDLCLELKFHGFRC